MTEKHLSLGVPWAVSILVVLISATVAIMLHIGRIDSGLQLVKADIGIVRDLHERTREIEIELARMAERQRLMALAPMPDPDANRVFSEILRRLDLAPRQPGLSSPRIGDTGAVD